LPSAEPYIIIPFNNLISRIVSELRIIDIELKIIGSNNIKLAIEIAKVITVNTTILNQFL